jgi:hypothetical protein
MSVIRSGIEEGKTVPTSGANLPPDVDTLISDFRDDLERR